MFKQKLPVDDVTSSNLKLNYDVTAMDDLQKIYATPDGNPFGCVSPLRFSVS